MKHVVKYLVTKGEIKSGSSVNYKGMIKEVEDVLPTLYRSTEESGYFSMYKEDCKLVKPHLFTNGVDMGEIVVKGLREGQELSDNEVDSLELKNKPKSITS